MKVKDLAGKVHTWSLAQYVGKENSNPSDLHMRMRTFLKKNYPALQVLEEVFLPGTGLYLDFYLPVMKIACECQGRQHNEFSIFMHKTQFNFRKAQARDNWKREFCTINGIVLIYFYPDESEEQWMKKLGLKKS